MHIGRAALDGTARSVFLVLSHATWPEPGRHAPLWLLDRQDV